MSSVELKPNASESSHAQKQRRTSHYPWMLFVAAKLLSQTQTGNVTMACERTLLQRVRVNARRQGTDFLLRWKHVPSQLRILYSLKASEWPTIDSEAGFGHSCLLTQHFRGWSRISANSRQVWGYRETPSQKITEKCSKGWQGDSWDKGAYHWACLPEFNSWHPRDRRRQSTDPSKLSFDLHRHTVVSTPHPPKINKCNKNFETAVTVFLGFADTFLERMHICKFLIPEQCGLAILLLPMLHCVFSGQMV